MSESLRDGGRAPRRSRFRAGERVRVKSAQEIAATLDEHGCLDGIPFMPEMGAYCGRTFAVRSSAHKTCAEGHGLRRLDAAVHLEGLRCDGSAHGGCQARCSLFWKDAWLESAPAGEATDGPDRAAQGVGEGAAQGVGEGAARGVGGEPAHGIDGAAELRCKAARSTRMHGRDPAEGTYSCQATELIHATAPLPVLSLRQYWDDVRSGNVTLVALAQGLWVMAIKVVQRLSARLLPPPLRLRGTCLYPDVAGTLEKTPDVRLGVQPGETVQTRPLAEIVQTLDARARNRGLSFEPGMVPFCGERLTVHRRVELIVDEASGELRRMKNPCVVFDGVVCESLHHRFCPRAADSYWREAWLRRGEGGEAAEG